MFPMIVDLARGVAFSHWVSRRCRQPVHYICRLLGLMSPELVTGVGEANIIDYSVDGRRECWKSYLAFMKVLYAFGVADFFDVSLNGLSREKTSPLPSWSWNSVPPTRSLPSESSENSELASLIPSTTRVSSRSCVLRTISLPY